jgi:hypothetical protein
MLEGIVATLVGGLILWSVTTPASQSVPVAQPAATLQSAPLPPPASPSQPIISSAERPDAKPDLSIPAAAMQACPSDATAQAGKCATPSSGANFVAAGPIFGSARSTLSPVTSGLPHSIPVGAILLYENFSRYRDGERTDWGLNASVRMGTDRRKWLVPDVNAVQPVGRRILLPREFYLECRYSAGMSEVTRGILGWWKEPIVSEISFFSERGIKYSIQWVIGCGNDLTRLNPLGSSSLYAKKYYHKFRLPDGQENEIGLLQPTGMLRVSRDNGLLKVFLGDQLVVTGSIPQTSQLVGFEVSEVKANSSTLSFTDFKVAR